MHVPSDAVCLMAQEGLKIERTSYAVSTDDLSTIGLTSEAQQLRPYETVDTVALLGLADQVQSLALPLPLLPCLSSGTTMTPASEVDDTVRHILLRHPALVTEDPRAVDVLLVSRANLLRTSEALPNAGGFIIDLGNLPPLNAEHLDRSLVALRSMAIANAPA
ncbi:MAG: hypothetical protein ACO3NY_06585, partial [Poseidonia sp.]